jgi:hypothetical protein
MKARLSSLARRPFVLSALLATVLAGTLFAVVSLHPWQASANSSVGGWITRSEVIARAQDWYSRNLTYCCNDGSRPASKFVTDVDGAHKYGPDCSGFVSMAWHVNPGSTGGYNTSSLPDVSTKIADRTHIKKGDILLDLVGSEHHVILFDAWQPDHVHFSYYSFGATPVRHYDGVSSSSPHGPLGSFTAGTKLAGYDQSHYVAYQYDHIVDEPHPGLLVDVNRDGYPDLIAKDASGTLYVWPHNHTTTIGTGMWGSRIPVYTLFNDYDWVTFTDLNGDGYPDILARDYGGYLYAFPHNNTQTVGYGTWGTRVLVGSGWHIYNVILLGHVSDGAYPDILGRDSSGVLWGYEHTASGAIGSGMWSSRVEVGSGWNGYSQIALDNIGHNNSRSGADGPELIGLDFAGNLYAYPNLDTGTLSAFGSRIQVGNGWNMYKTFLTGDIDGDGYTDLLGLDVNGNLYAYPNKQFTDIGSGMWGSRIQVGGGWQSYTLVD